MTEESDLKILITGGTGFVGSHLVELLNSQGYSQVHVTTFSNREGYVQSILPQDHIHQVDLTDKTQTDRLFEEIKPDRVYHLAAFADVGGSFEKSALVMQNNTNLQLNVMEAIKLHVPEARVLSVGSALQYGLVSEQDVPVKENQAFKPVNPYAVSKVTQELISFMYQKMYGLKVILARSFNHVGERQTDAFAIPAFASQIVAVEQGKLDHLMVGNLVAQRDIADVKDVVAAYQVLMEKGTVGEVYNVGSGTAHKMDELLKMLVSKAKTTIEIKIDPTRIRPVDMPIMVADVTKLKSLGWQQRITLDDTLNRVLEWHRQNIITK